MILQKLKEWWNHYGFEIMIVISLIILGIYWLTRIGKKGTYSTSYMYLPGISQTVKKGRQPIKESKGEQKCREVMERLFKKLFNKCRPDFLNNPVTGGSYNCEIDCYCDDLKLGVEYSGKQHYEYIPYFHKNKEAFYNQKYRDFFKKKACKENGVTLIEVPYTVKIDDIESYLKTELQKNGYKF